jgi:glutathione S-transferase
MDVLRLHDNLTSGNGFKARLLLAQLGIAYQRIEYDIDKRETRTAEFLAKNPNGRVPLLELEDGSFLPESNAILWYLAEGTRFLPEERRARAEVLQWLFFEQYSHEPNIATVRFWITHKVAPTPLIELSMPAKRALGAAALGVMETHLSGRRFFVGDRYTIADIALYAYSTSPARGASTSRPSPRCGAGSRASRVSRATFRSPKAERAPKAERGGQG